MRNNSPTRGDTTAADAKSFLVENHNMSSKSADRLAMSTTINCTRADSINQTLLAKVRGGRTNSTGVVGTRKTLQGLSIWKYG
jgi:hypothetical protein